MKEKVGAERARELGEEGKVEKRKIEREKERQEGRGNRRDKKDGLEERRERKEDRNVRPCSSKRESGLV